MKNDPTKHLLAAKPFNPYATNNREQVVLVRWEQAEGPMLVTWLMGENGDLSHGHYFTPDEASEAEADFEKRGHAVSPTVKRND